MKASRRRTSGCAELRGKAVRAASPQGELLRHGGIFLLLQAALALALTSPLCVRVWQLAPAGLVSSPASWPLRPLAPPAAADLDGDGRSERLALSDDRATILAGNQTLWQTPDEWRVTQAALTDFNRDGVPEATLLVWRPFRPWPADRWLPHGGRIAGFHDGQGDSCQLILIGWRGNRYGELWAGSALARPVLRFAAADLNDDGAQELAVLQGGYTEQGSTPAQVLNIWIWNGFGFELVSSAEGSFLDLSLAEDGAGRVVVVAP